LKVKDMRILKIISVFLFILFVNSCGGGNKAPMLISKVPLERDVDVWAFEAVDFSVVAEDPEGKNLYYEWFVNGITAGTGSTLSFIKDEKDTGNSFDILCNISDGKNKITTEWHARIVSPLYFLNEIRGFFSEAFTSPFSRENVLTNVDNILIRDISIYKGKDYNSNGYDDYDEIFYNYSTMRGFLKLTNIYEQIENIFPDPNIVERSYYKYEIPFNLDGVVPGLKCDPLIDMKITAMESMLTTVIPTLELIKNDLDFGDNDFPVGLTVESPSISFLNNTYSLTGIYELDNGDIYITDAVVSLLLSFLHFIKGYSDDTLKGIIALLFDKCIKEYPWFSRNHFNAPYPDFGLIVDTGEIKDAKPFLLSFLIKMKQGIDYINSENDVQSDDIFKIVDADGNGLAGFNIGSYSLDAYDRINPLSLTSVIIQIESAVENNSTFNISEILQDLLTLLTILLLPCLYMYRVKDGQSLQVIMIIMVYTQRERFIRNLMEIG